MRKVASYTMATKVSPQTICAANGAVIEAIENWLNSKGTVSRNEQGGTIKFSDGREADFLLTASTSKAGEITEYELTEPTESGLFQTVIRLGRNDSDLALYSELRVGSPPNVLTPLFYDARCPSVIRSIIDQKTGWFVGEVPLQTQPIRFHGQQGATALAQLIWHRSRTLPVIAVSEYEGSALTPQLAEKLAADLTRISHEAGRRGR